MKFGKLEIEPARNPAVLDTATWDPVGAWDIVKSLEETYWQSVTEAAALGCRLPGTDKFTSYPGSSARWRGGFFFLAGLADGQQVFMEIGSGQGQEALGAPVGTIPLQSAELLAIYRTDLHNVARYVQTIRPSRGPQAMGDVPRLGIGNRMTTAQWPAIYRAMDVGNFAANAVQNSMRELNILDDLLAGQPAEKNYGPNFGTVESGHTGSTFEGLWLYGVLEALKAGSRPRYGADADHMQVKRGDDQVSRTKRALDAARYYTFYTMDVSDILDYEALAASPALAEGYLARISDARERSALVAYHRDPVQIAGTTYRIDETTVQRLVGKYWEGLEVMQVLTDHVRQLKDGQPFDLEFAIDEAPPGVQACDAITTNAELLFVIREAQRRGLPLSHIACNFGIEKEVDYRCPDKLPGLEQRVRTQFQLAARFGVMLDFHSGDDLSADTRRVLGRATGGHNHFKVSPSLQLLFAETLNEVHPERFRVWWEETLAYARREAEAGSLLAVECLREYETGGDLQPGVHHRMFHHYGFAFVGRRDADGQYSHRGSLYGLSPAFYAAYHERVIRFLCQLADELFHPEIEEQHSV